MTPDVVFRSRRTVLPDGVRAASVRVRSGRIAAIGGFDDAAGGARVVDAGECLLMPGLVDTHVHVNEPGRTEWEGFDTATRAAAAGGVTTLVDMPLNSAPATTSLAGLRAKLDAARARCDVDVGLWGGVVPGNEAELRPLWDAGVLGFKCFLAPSGVDEFGHVGEADLRRALPILAALGAPLLVHAELPAVLERTAASLRGDPRAYATYLRSRPPEAETEAIRLMVALCREFGARVHIVHVAAAEALPVLRDARAEGLPITAESCPHYLHFAAEEIRDDGLEWKCAPPIRGRAHRDRLWAALAAGDLDLVASDHSPCPPAMKAGDWFSAWGGIASLQLGLPVMWNEARARGFGPERIAQWMATAPARLAGLERKGAIAVGHDADLVVWDPDGETAVAPAMLQHRHPVTPYAGEVFAGAVRATYVRGVPVFDGGRFADRPVGRILLRDSA
jgi:allantoinase